MDEAVTRSGLWLLLGIAAVFAAGLAADSGFAVHMGICAIAATIAAFVAMNRVGGAPAAAPRVADRYDDEVIRWGVIATVFWAVVGFLAGIVIAADSLL